MAIECGACEGRGECAYEVGVHGNGDPETDVVIDECETCRGTGEVFCGTCDELAAVRTKRGFRCVLCAADDLNRTSAKLVDLATHEAGAGAAVAPGG